MIRILLICGFVFLIFVSAIGAAFNIGGPHWAAVSATALTVVGVLIALGQWLIPLATDKSESMEVSTPSLVISDKFTFEQAFELLQKREESKLKEGSSNQGTGTLVVWATKENRGVTVYLLSRDEWLNCKTSRERDSNKQKKRATITGERFGTYLLYVAIFRGLKPDRYNAWTAWGKERPKSVALSILPGQISELELDWQD
jgi:hypothetical protein